MKVVKAVIFVLSLLLVVQSVCAIGVSITAKITLYQDVKTNEFTLVKNFVKVSNPNSYPVSIKMQASDFIELSDIEFMLQPGQYRNVNFTVVMGHTDYEGEIDAVFSADGHLPFKAACPVTIYVRNVTSGTNNHPPTKPALISPNNGASFNSDSVTLSWSPSYDSDNNALVYYYEVDDNSDFSSPTYYGWTAETQKALSIEKNKTYYWRITASDSINSRASDTWSFRSTNRLPEKPVLISPANNSSLNSKPTLKWSSVTDPDGDTVYYDIVVDDNSDFSSAVILKRMTNIQYNTNPDNLTSGRYYWKVRSSDGTGESDFSSVWNFVLNIPYCGDGTCSNNETTCSCPQDCGSRCGDGCCNSGENCSSCSSDCGSCSSGGNNSSNNSGGSNNGGSSGSGSSGNSYTPDEEQDLSGLKEALNDLNNEISLIKEDISNANAYLIEIQNVSAIMSEIEGLQKSASSENDAEKLSGIIDQLTSLKEGLEGLVPDISIAGQISLHYNSLKEKEINDIQSEFMVKPLNINATRMVKLIEINRQGTITYQTYFEVVVEDLKNESIIERIPKSIAQNVSDITFTSVPKIIKSDPVVEFNASFSYVVDGNKIDATSDYGRPIVYKESIAPSTGITGMLVQYGAVAGLFIIAAGIAVYFIFFRTKKESYSGYRYKR
jgi:uncharacterized membrane protein YgcG